MSINYSGAVQEKRIDAVSVQAGSIAVGPYAVSLPAPGPTSAPAPTTTDANGNTTINNLLTSGGTVVVIPEGTYTISGAISIPTGKTMKAAEGVSVILKAANGYTGHMVSLSTVSNCEISNITFDGNYANRTAQEGSTNYAVMITGGSGHLIKNCKFMNCPSFGVWAYNSSGLEIFYNQFVEVYHPIRIDGNNLTGTGSIEGNTFLNTTAFKSIQGIEAINTKSLSIKHNTLEGAGVLEPTTHGFEGTWGNSIYIFNSDGFLVENNTCNPSYWSAFVAGQASTNSTVQRNYFSKGTFGGATGGLNSAWIEQTGTQYITFDRNRLNGGMLVGDVGGDHCTITNNIIDAYGVGIDVSDYAKDILIQGNTITRLSGTDNGLYLWNKNTSTGINCRVLDNIITGFNNGISINNTGATGTVYNLTITGNHFVSNTNNITIPGTITVDSTCTIQSSSAAKPSPAALELGTAGMTTVIASIPLENPIGTVGYGGLLTLAGFPKSVTVSGSGNVVEARIRTTGGTDIVTGLTVGTKGQKDILLENTTLTSGVVLRLTSVTLATWGAKIGTNFGGMELSSGVRYGASTRPNLNITPPRTTDVSWLAKCGFTRTRLPVVWELLQPVLSSSLANATIRNGFNPALSSNGALYQTYRDWITAVLDAHASNGMTCVLDLHNYCRYRDFRYNLDGSVDGFVAAPDAQTQPYSSVGAVEGRIFSLASGATLTQADFNDVWTKIVNYWGVNWNGTGLPHPGLGGYGLMNEPNTMPAVGSTLDNGSSPEDLTIWPTYAQGAINTIRALDSTTPIYVAGNVWSSTENWVTQNPGFPLTGSNLVYEGHIYLDSVSNGHRFDWSLESGLGATVQSGVNRLTPFKNWLERYGLKGCIGEIGMPTDGDAVGNAAWQESFYNTVLLALQNNIEVFSWVGGSSWAYRNYPITHSANWHQGKTMEPEINGVFDATRRVQRVELFVDGSGHGLNASNAVTAVTIRVGSRGHSLAAITVTVASDNGGTFSKTTLTIPAGANKYDTFTFTPGAVNRTSNLSFTVTSPSGLAAPATWTVYSHTNPVALSSTDLTTAAKALLAKYSAAKWVASDAYTDYIDGAACANTDPVRAIADTGYASDITNVMEMVNFHNTTISGYMGISSFNTDGGGKKYLSFGSTEVFGLWCRKWIPSSPGWLEPQQRLDRDLGTTQFSVVAYAITSTSAEGTLFSTCSCEGSEHISLKLTGGQANMVVYESSSATNTLNGTTPALNTPHIASMRCKQGSQKLRMQSVETGSSTLTLTGGAFLDSMIIGGSVLNSWQTGLTNARIYCVIAGVGEPTDPELVVLEKYASSLSGGSL